ncbi:MAG TPA: exodeoxyribonuclease VII large subunit [Candidatus Acidoferrales bacterium]|nr:exodeoxyribonuclease VII large subunit [Candidatus Acidoferrales bacterium]
MSSAWEISSRATRWPPQAAARPVLSVTQLNEIVREALERTLPGLWVVGEISNFRVPPSGHFYFTLKDDQSQIAAVMFRRRGQRLPFQPENGMEVLCYGRVGVYPVRGDLQLYVDTIEPRGRGAKQIALEQLKERLWKEGLFSEKRKRPLPFLPRSIGIVTSLHGAAVRDMLRIISDRFADRRIVISPVKVQGDGAGAEIAAAIRDLGESGEVDVLIVGRGGGSAEDLWSFNEEAVARALAAVPVPVISAVGHEIDFTLADLVADRRAPTPSAAAEMVVPSKRELVERVARLESRLESAANGRLERAREGWLRLRRRLADPTRRLRERQLRVDELSLSLERRMRGMLLRFRQAVSQIGKRLNGVSPLAVLERGYSLVLTVPEGKVVKSSAGVEIGDEIKIRFAQGSARCRVEEKSQ